MSQRITTITRSRFLQLYQGIQDGTLAQRWPKGKTALTKAQKVEARQLGAMVKLVDEAPDLFRRLLNSTNWNEVEFIKTRDGGVRVQAKRISGT